MQLIITQLIFGVTVSLVTLIVTLFLTTQITFMLHKISKKRLMSKRCLKKDFLDILCNIPDSQAKFSIWNKLTLHVLFSTCRQFAVIGI